MSAARRQPAPLPPAVEAATPAAGGAVDVPGQVRELRKRRGMTLKAVSAASGISVSTLSKLETGKVRLTFDAALALSGIFKVPVTAFLGGGAGGTASRRSVTRAGDGVVHDVAGIRFEVLCSEFKEKRNVFWRVTVSGRTIDDCGGWRRHPVEEFIHVMAGTLELHTEHYETALLGAGDSILFDAMMPHAYATAGAGDAILLMSNTITPEAEPPA